MLKFGKYIMASLSSSDISEAIRSVIADFLVDEPRGIFAINDGLCEDLAYAVIHRLSRKEGDGIHTVEAE
jgi:hypothetical protein